MVVVVVSIGRYILRWREDQDIVPAGEKGGRRMCKEDGVVVALWGEVEKERSEEGEFERREEEEEL